MAISGVTEELWTEENEKAVDQFIVDTSITVMVVYKDTSMGLRVEYTMPLWVKHSFQLFFFFTFNQFVSI